ncbi:hypothetical protein K438DRAFT_342867 [Mycena galopus ATCC 62051]|nr:hypothetical protein K438DRAFT_342867 [Mycena galopus ATCC 62051]
MHDLNGTGCWRVWIWISGRRGAWGGRAAEESDYDGDECWGESSARGTSGTSGSGSGASGGSMQFRMSIAMEAPCVRTACAACFCLLCLCMHAWSRYPPPPPSWTRLSYSLPMTSPSPPNARIEPIAYRQPTERNEYRHIFPYCRIHPASYYYFSRLPVFPPPPPPSSNLVAIQLEIQSKTKERITHQSFTVQLFISIIFSFPFLRELSIYLSSLHTPHSLRPVYSSIHPVLLYQLFSMYQPLPSISSAIPPECKSYDDDDYIHIFGSYSYSYCSPDSACLLIWF